MLQFFGLLSGVLNILCYIPYIRDTLRGTTKPERASWFIWTVLGTVAFFSQWEKGATDSLWLTGTQAFGVVIVFLLSIKYGVGGFVKRDFVALCVAAFGLVAWYFTKEAAIALFIVIFVDSVGTFLTVLKSYKDPGSETLITWILAGTAGLLAILAVGTWNIILLSYPFYILVANIAVVAAVFLGKRRQRQRG